MPSGTMIHTVSMLKCTAWLIIYGTNAKQATYTLMCTTYASSGPAEEESNYVVRYGLGANSYCCVKGCTGLSGYRYSSFVTAWYMCTV